MTSKEALILLLGSHFGDGRAKRKVDKYYDEIENQLLTDLDRLEEYSKIEKELGLDLPTLFKVLRTGVYIKQYGEIEHYFLKLFGDGINFCLTTYTGTKVILKPDEFGKTWAVDKKDLE